MLFAITGSQGSGKTTVLNALSYSTIDRKTSRSILTDWNVRLDEVNTQPDLTMKFQEEISKRKWADDCSVVGLPPYGSIYFTERTFIDLLTYTTVSLGKENKFDQWLSEYGKDCISRNYIYTHIFYLKAGHFKPEEDGVRGHNEFYSDMVDATMLHMYEKYQTGSDRLTIIDTPSVDERVRTINAVVQGYQSFLY